MYALKRFCKVLHIFLSAHIAIIEDGANNGKCHVAKYLKILSLFGLPPFNLELKFGCYIMLMQSIVLYQWLCNGSCLVIIQLTDKVKDTRLLSENYKGQLVFSSNNHIMFNIYEDSIQIVAKVVSNKSRICNDH